jgi:hypothetical protein
MMHATVRRYEGVDPNRIGELKQKVNETLIPKLSKLPGFNGYYVVQSDNGVFTSFGLFGTSAEADESTRVAASWVREEKLDALLPNPPKVTGGEVIAQSNGIKA